MSFHANEHTTDETIRGDAETNVYDIMDLSGELTERENKMLDIAVETAIRLTEEHSSRRAALAVFIHPEAE